MRAVMYHYVRTGAPDLPHFRYLHLDDFRRQLDHFADAGGFVARDDFLAAVAGEGPPAEVVPGHLLTFDDGLLDHWEFVGPELADRGLWGLFFASSGPAEDGVVLDVHRTHQLLGRRSGDDVERALADVLEPEDLRPADQVAGQGAYRTQGPEDATIRAKRTLNYAVADGRRTGVIDRLEAALGLEAPTVAATYASPAQLRDLVAAGNVVGSHAASHRPMATLAAEVQAEEIRASFAWLDEVLAGLDRPRSFSYPHGGGTFDATTIGLLRDASCTYAFSVEARDVAAADLADPFALPRWDCNQFPHGAAAMGMEPVGG